MRYIKTNTKEQCQSRCDELTIAYKKLFTEDEIDVYSNPIDGVDGWYCPIVEGTEYLFTQSELDSSVAKFEQPVIEERVIVFP